MVIVPTEKHIDWKRPPVVLFSIVVLNILIFALYQGLDDHRFQNAIDTYNDYQLLEVELPAYRAYRFQNNDTRPLDQEALKDPWLAWEILGDPEFRAFIQERGGRYIKPHQFAEWQRSRQHVDTLVNKISYYALGLTPSDPGIFSFLTYQFLHGDLMHLLGNMVFLLLVGFAAEAALGAWRFLAYYLISGVAAGVLFLTVELITGTGHTSLVGASGSVSGVMAMYVALYRLRKIEFFYWFFIFTGYFRAAALVILPVYILKELYFLMSSEGSNIAYTAHIGGFLAGAGLVIATQTMQQDAIDHEYLEVERKSPPDPYRAGLHKLYREIGRCNFLPAWNRLVALRKKYGENEELIEIQFNLLSVLDPDKAKEFLVGRMGKTNNHPNIIQAQADHWGKLSQEQRAELPLNKRIGLAADVLSLDWVHISEEIFEGLKTEKSSRDAIAVLARKIAAHYERLDRSEKAEEYQQQADQLMLQAMPNSAQIF